MQTNKLDAMEARFRSLEDQLSDPSVISNQNIHAYDKLCSGMFQ